MRQICHDIVSRAFLASILITRDASRAESIVIEAIEGWNPEAPIDSAFVRGVIEHSVASPASGHISQLSNSTVPSELHRVFGLEPEVRRCFVLRVLEQLPRQICAQMLRLTASQVDRYSALAVSQLTPEYV